MGYDTPRPLGESAFGGTLCAPIFVEFIQKAMEGQGPVTWAVPPGGHFIKIDRHTGQRLPDYAEGANVQAEYIRDGQELMVGDFGQTVDAGWKMGADVPLFDNVRNSPAIERVTVRGQTKSLPSTRPSARSPAAAFTDRGPDAEAQGLLHRFPQDRHHHDEGRPGGARLPGHRPQRHPRPGHRQQARRLGGDAGNEIRRLPGQSLAAWSTAGWTPSTRTRSSS